MAVENLNSGSSLEYFHELSGIATLIRLGDSSFAAYLHRAFLQCCLTFGDLIPEKAFVSLLVRTMRYAKVIERIEERIAQLRQWLQQEGPECFHEQKHLDAGPERVYWHFGYLSALNDVLQLLRKPGNPAA